MEEGKSSIVLLLPDDSFGYPAETLLRAARREVYLALEEEDLRIEIASPEKPGIGVPASVLKEVGNLLRRHGLLPGGWADARADASEEAGEYSTILMDENVFPEGASFGAAPNAEAAGPWESGEAGVSDDTVVLYPRAEEPEEGGYSESTAGAFSVSTGAPASAPAPSAFFHRPAAGSPGPFEKQEAGAPVGGNTAQLPGREEIRREEARRKAARRTQQTYAARRPEGAMPHVPPVKHPTQGLSRALAHREDTFQVQLFRMIDARHMSDAEVYRRANLDRRLFSKIRSNPNYQPKKQTALALAISLGLSLPETQDLLQRAGLALSRSSTFDLIIRYCIEEGIDDIFSVNALLYAYDQPLLGG